MDRVTRAQLDLYEAGEYDALSATLRPVAEALLEELGPRPGERVLDLGAGDGNVAVAASSYGVSAVACDLSVVQLGRARSRVPGLAAVAGDASRLPLADGVFDAVVSVFGAVAVPRPEDAAAEAFRVCRSGGRVLFTAWPADSLVGELTALVRSAAPEPGSFPDQELGWGDPETASVRFATHGDDVLTERRTLDWDATVRGSRGSADFAAGYAAQHLPGLDLGTARAEVLARHTTDAGRVQADYLVVSATAR